MIKNKSKNLCLIIFLFFLLQIVGCAEDLSVSESQNTEMEKISSPNNAVATEETELDEGIFEIKSSDTDASTGENIIIDSDKENPIIVDVNNITSLKVGDYVRLSGPASIMSTSDGKIRVGDSEIGVYTHCGVEMVVRDANDKYTYYDVIARTISPGEYEEVFKEHPPADFQEEPSVVGNMSFSGCRMTITGTVDRILITDDDGMFYGISLGDDSVVESLELFY